MEGQGSVIRSQGVSDYVSLKINSSAFLHLFPSIFNVGKDRIQSNLSWLFHFPIEVNSVLKLDFFSMYGKMTECVSPILWAVKLL